MARVVMVDDDDGLLYLASLGVATSGHDIVASFSSALAAKQWSGWGDVDVVLTDYRMAPADGSILLDWLIEEHPHVRRVLVSSGRIPPTAKGKAHKVVDRHSLSVLADAVDEVMEL